MESVHQGGILQIFPYPDTKQCVLSWGVEIWISEILRASSQFTKNSVTPPRPIYDQLKFLKSLLTSTVYVSVGKSSSMKWIRTSRRYSVVSASTLQYVREQRQHWGVRGRHQRGCRQARDVCYSYILALLGKRRWPSPHASFESANAVWNEIIDLSLHISRLMTAFLQLTNTLSTPQSNPR